MSSKLNFKFLGQANAAPDDEFAGSDVFANASARKFKISDRWILEDSFFEKMVQFLGLNISIQEIKSVCQSHVPDFISKLSNHGPVTAAVWERLFVEHLSNLEERRTPVVAGRLRNFRRYLNIQNDLFKNANWLHRQEWICSSVKSGEFDDSEYFQFVWKKIKQKKVCDNCCCGETSCLAFERLVEKLSFEFSTKKLDESDDLMRELTKLAPEGLGTEDHESWARWTRASQAMDKTEQDAPLFNLLGNASANILR